MGWKTTLGGNKQRGKTIFPTSHFAYAFSHINQQIAEFRKIPRKEKQQLALKLAEILDNINYLHPFREGNGRAQREFLRALALEKGVMLNLNPPDDESVYKKYMKGTIESDVATLYELILDLINPH